ncbi:hypothetical protein D6745_00165 [Candidatus Woesearchaeota archaeon]|nr:MAG: hypothetical protein D6745_00165 [Candidatus Woesearchaeota archaeon]
MKAKSQLAEVRRNILTGEEAVSYLDRILALIPESGLRNALISAKLLFKKPPERLAVYVSPLTGFPSIPSLKSDSKAGIDANRHELGDVRGLERVVKGEWGPEEIAVMVNREGNRVKTQELTVLDEETGSEFKYWPPPPLQLNGQPSNLLLTYSPRERKYIFFSDSVSESLRQLERNLRFIEVIRGRRICKDFLKDCLFGERGFDRTAERVARTAEYVKEILEHFEKVYSSERDSPEMAAQSLSEIREKARSECGIFFRYTQESGFVRNVKKRAHEEVRGDPRRGWRHILYETEVTKTYLDHHALYLGSIKSFNKVS